MRPLGAYRELPLCVVPAHTENQAQSGQDAGGGGSSGGETSGYAVNTDLGFLSVPVSATAAEVHRYVEVGHLPFVLLQECYLKPPVLSVCSRWYLPDAPYLCVGKCWLVICSDGLSAFQAGGCPA